MRRHPRWLPPVVGAVLALVLGLGGAVLGSRFAPSPVAAPSAGAGTLVDSAPAPQIPVDQLPTDVAGLEALIGEAEAAAGATPASVPAVIDASPTVEAVAVETLLDTVAASEDPEGAAGVFTLAPTTDPCLEAPSADCPAGVETTVLGIDVWPPLRVIRAGTATTAASGIGAECARDGELALAVVTNQPVRLEATYFGDAGTGTAYGRTTDAALAAWDEARAGKDWRDVSWPNVTTCVSPEAVVAGAVYDVHIGVTADRDADDRDEPDADAESTYVRFSFNGDGAPTRPAARIFTAGDAGDVVVTTVPHRAGETVTVRPVEFAGTTDRGCDASTPVSPDHVRPLSTPRTTEVSADDLLARNELPDMTRLTTVAFAVNEGLTVRFCVTVATAAGVDDYLASAVVRTADRLVPVISLYATYADMAERSVNVTGYLGNGRRCGRHIMEPQTDRAFPTDLVLCDLRSAAGTQGAAWPADQPLPLSRSVLDRFTVTLDDNLEDDAATALSIDLAELGRCYARCVPPADSYHSLYWAGPGSTPDRAWFIVRVHWEQGNANGSFASTVSGFSEFDPAGLLVALAPPEHVTLDTTNAVLRQVANDPVNREAFAQIDIRADQLGFWRARLIPAPGSGELCLRDRFAIDKSGVLGAPGPAGTTWGETVTVQFEGLCVGSDYAVVITLTALDGEVSVWGSDRFVAGAPRDAFIGGEWPGSRLHTFDVERTLEVSYEVYDSGTMPEGRRPFFVSADMDGAPLIGPRSYGCFRPTATIAFGAPVTQNYVVGEQLHLSGRLELADSQVCQTGGVLRLSSQYLPVGWEADLDLGTIDGNPDGVRIQIRPEPVPGAELPDAAARMALVVIIKRVG